MMKKWLGFDSTEGYLRSGAVLRVCLEPWRASRSTVGACLSALVSVRAVKFPVLTENIKKHCPKVAPKIFSTLFKVSLAWSLSYAGSHFGGLFDVVSFLAEGLVTCSKWC